MKDIEQLSRYDYDENAYPLIPATKRTISELLDSESRICNYDDENFGFPSQLSRRSTVQTLNYLPDDQIKEEMPEPDLTYSVPDDESVDEFDAITGQCPSRKQSSTSVNLAYY